MKFDIVFERTYPHSRNAVWKALTDKHALTEWLMQTDFVAKQGCKFNMWCQNSNGTTDHYLCELIEIDPPSRMLWSWLLEGRDGATLVEFLLEEVAGGTKLTLRHSGDRDPDTIDAFKGGWPNKLDQLGISLV